MSVKLNFVYQHLKYIVKESFKTVYHYKLLYIFMNSTKNYIIDINIDYNLVEVCVFTESIKVCQHGDVAELILFLKKIRLP